MNFGDLLPKSALPGSLQPEWKRCGKPRCRCASGQLHGPYWVHRWREDGRQRKAYVPRDRVASVQAALALWQRLHPPVWSAGRELSTLKRLTEEVQPWTMLPKDTTPPT
jgi:uncharacterized protein DUF6788